MRSKVITALVAMWMMASIVNATDVTKFKIDGVGLGDKYSAKKISYLARIDLIIKLMQKLLSLIIYVKIRMELLI